MSRDDPDLDRHLWVVRPPEQYKRMTKEELAAEIASLKERNDDGWAKHQKRKHER